MEVLAETISENDPASPRYQTSYAMSLGRTGGRSIAVMEFTSGILAPTVPTARGIGLARISESGEVESIVKECAGQPRLPTKSCPNQSVPCQIKSRSGFHFA